MAELARPHGTIPQDGLGSCHQPVGPARRVLGGRGNRSLGDRVGDAQDDPHSGAGVDCRDCVRGLPEDDAERGEARGDRFEVVGIGHADAELDEAPPRRGDEAELLAAVGGGEPAVIEPGQPELLVVGGCLGDVRDADADGRETVQGHDDCLC